jgi:AP2-associated kinase
MAAFNSQAAPRGPFGHSAPIIAPGAPAGTFTPGTKVQVGNHRVVIEKYLSEGGFAHVYVVRLPKPVDGSELAVLKRVAVPDKEHLANMRTEVETMKKLKGHRHIVRYIDSHASQLKGGGYEVFLLMEYCSGGGLIDFMNTRLRNRLTEPEILNIFSDVAEGVACMHYLRPPLLHRDLKVENVLISSSGSSRTYKLCDFGSTAPPRAAASSAAEGRLIEDDIQRHTTLQYRSPEMIDVYRKQPIDEKSDVWALGVFLYKLCYYTTPFEEVGQMAILNATFTFPAYPHFSDKLKLLIATMLKENPAKRPTIYQVLLQACSMQGKEIPIRDIYTGRSLSENRKSQQLSNTAQAASTAAGAMLSPPSEKKTATIPDIAPMRRGRPTKAVSHHGSAQPSPSPLRMIDQADPFSSLDGSKVTDADELSSRFPTLDQFSLLTEKGKKFEFEPSAPGKSEPEKPDLSQRVLNALVDEAFARPPSPEKPKPLKTTAQVTNLPSGIAISRKKSYEANEMRQKDDAISPAPQRPSMVSTGTMTSPSPPPSFSDRPIHRFPPVKHARRPSSLPRSSEASRPMSGMANSGSMLSNLLNQDAARSQAAAEPKSPSSSRPSLELARPSMMELDDSISRSRSTNSKMRPASMNIVSKMEFYRGRISSKSSSGAAEKPVEEALASLMDVESDTNITSDVEFLRAKEEEEKVWKGHKRHSSGSVQKKRSSLPSLSLSGTKNLLAGRFGDAFRKFEGGGNASIRRSRSPSPSQDPINMLTPIAGSEATDLSDERHGLDETEDLSPEMKRELERRRLSAEEKRVASAAAEYRKRLTEKGGEGGRDPARAVSIQYKVQSLLKENERPTVKTAAGYGRFTNSDASSQMKQFEAPRSMPIKHPPRMPGIQSVVASSPAFLEKSHSEPPSTITSPPNLSSRVALATSQRNVTKPAAPPKPKSMRTGPGETVLRPLDISHVNSDLATSPTDDWQANFSKRYPSLSGLEMVETEIDRPNSGTVRTKEL